MALHRRQKYICSTDLFPGVKSTSTVPLYFQALKEHLQYRFISKHQKNIYSTALFPGVSSTSTIPLYFQASVAHLQYRFISKRLKHVYSTGLFPGVKRTSTVPLYFQASVKSTSTVPLCSLASKAHLLYRFISKCQKHIYSTASFPSV